MIPWRVLVLLAPLLVACAATPRRSAELSLRVAGFVKSAGIT